MHVKDKKILLLQDKFLFIQKVKYHIFHRLLFKDFFNNGMESAPENSEYIGFQSCTDLKYKLEFHQKQNLLHDGKLKSINFVLPTLLFNIKELTKSKLIFKQNRMINKRVSTIHLKLLTNGKLCFFSIKFDFLL